MISSGMEEEESWEREEQELWKIHLLQKIA